MQDLNAVFLHFLKDMYFAEQQIANKFGEYARLAASDELKQALVDQALESKQNIERLTNVFDAIGQKVEGATCEAILGLMKEVEELIQDTGRPGPLQDAGLLACVQAMQHYEIARFGALRAWAVQQRNDQAKVALDGLLVVTERFNALFDQIAFEHVNKAAATAP